MCWYWDSKCKFTQCQGEDLVAGDHHIVYISDVTRCHRALESGDLCPITDDNQLQCKETMNEVDDLCPVCSGNMGVVARWYAESEASRYD